LWAKQCEQLPCRTDDEGVSSQGGVRVATTTESCVRMRCSRGIRGTATNGDCRRVKDSYAAKKGVMEWGVGTQMGGTLGVGQFGYPEIKGGRLPILEKWLNLILGAAGSREQTTDLHARTWECPGTARRGAVGRVWDAKVTA